MITIGTHSLRADQCVETVRLALELGYRRIDTAAAYKNEHLVSQGILRAKIPRNEIHITTKIGPKDMTKGAESVRKCLEQSLANLYSAFSNENETATSTPHYIDCVLLHWPGVAGFPPESEKHKELRKEAWKVLCDFRSRGIVREIGVSNFLVRHLDSLIEGENEKANNDDEGKTNKHSKNNNQIDVVQMELHPWCQQQDAVEWCQKHNVWRIESYGLFGGGKCLEKTQEFIDKSQKNDDGNDDDHVDKEKSLDASRLLLNWCVRQKGFVPVVRASKQEHLERNLFFVKERPIRDSSKNFFGDETNGDNKNQDEHFYWYANLIA